MTLVDTQSEFGARVMRRLDEEIIVWLTTVGNDGMPQPSPVWFLWNGETLLIYSKPNAPKVRNIARRAQVALSFNCGFDGDNVVVFNATAIVDDKPVSEEEFAAYIAKYAPHIVNLNMTNEAFAAEYSQAIRVTPHKVRGY